MVAYIDKCKELGRQLDELMEAIKFFLGTKVSAKTLSSLKERLKKVEVLINSIEPVVLMYVYWLYVNMLPEIGFPIGVKDRLNYMEQALSDIKDTLETLNKNKIFPKLPFPWNPLQQDMDLRRKLVLNNLVKPYKLPQQQVNELIRVFDIGYIAYESECSATEGLILLGMAKPEKACFYLKLARVTLMALFIARLIYNLLETQEEYTKLKKRVLDKLYELEAIIKDLKEQQKCT